MIAIDLDGTLLSPTGDVTPRTKAAVHRCLAGGYLVCFATGRNFTESKTVLDAVAHYASAVFVGGAMVIDTRQRITLHRTLMDPGLARELCEFFESRSHAVLALQDTGHAGVDYLMSRRHRPQRRHPAVAESDGGDGALGCSGLPHHPHEHTIRVGIVAPAETARTQCRPV